MVKAEEATATSTQHSGNLDTFWRQCQQDAEWEDAEQNDADQGDAREGAQSNTQRNAQKDVEEGACES